MKLATLGLIVFIGTVVNAVPDMYASKYRNSYPTPAPVYQKSYSAGYKYSMGPKVNWAYWTNDGLVSQNQEHQKTEFATVDCDLNKNIIFYDFKNINFGQEFVYEWTDESEAQEFSAKLAQIRKRCPDVRVAIDPEISWNQEIVDQIVQKKVSVGQLAKSITDFNTKYYTDGFVLTFSPNVVLNDKLTYEFLKELRRLFTQNKLQLILYFGPDEGLSYVRPVVFEFADLLIVHTEIYFLDDGKSLRHPSPAFSNDVRSSSGIIEAFINMGADRSKISLLVSTTGNSFKRVACTSETELNCPAAGLGSVIYSEKTLVVESKNIQPYFHDRPTICRIISDSEWTKKYDNFAQVPYAYNSEQWIGYENEQSIKVKTDLIKEKKIAGVTIISLNSDDIYNLCGNGDYSFTRQFVEAFEY